MPPSAVRRTESILSMTTVTAARSRTLAALDIRAKGAGPLCARPEIVGARGWRRRLQTSSDPSENEFEVDKRHGSIDDVAYLAGTSHPLRCRRVDAGRCGTRSEIP